MRRNQATLPNRFALPDERLKDNNMLLTRAREWEPGWLLEGRQKGEAALLLRLLERKFGVLPDWVAERVTAANTYSLEAWGLRILDARSLEDVIDERPA